MKKLIAILIIFLSACTSVKKDEFVNPIFYKTMYPISRTTGITWITPTSFKCDFHGNVTTGDCILLENKQDSVKLKCEVRYSGEDYSRTEIIKYQFSTDSNPYNYNENEQEIEEINLEKETGEEFSSKAWLYIKLSE
jgi:hypothetical protein